MSNFKDTGKTVMMSVNQIVAVVLLILVTSLIVGTLLSTSSFSGTSTNNNSAFLEDEEMEEITNVSATVLDMASAFPGSVCTFDAVYNTSNDAPISSGNYTNPSSCAILATDDSEFIGYDWSANVTTIVGSLGTDVFDSVDNVTAGTLSASYPFPTALCTITSVENNSNHATISSGNYTESSECEILATDDSEFIGYDWDVNYTWTNLDTEDNELATSISNAWGLFVAAIIGFFAVIGVIIAIVWLIGYIKPLFSKEDGIQTFTGS